MVLSQFSDPQGRQTLANYIDMPGVYPAGRLDYDSEGLLLLCDNGALQSRIADPRHKMRKTYRVQVEGDITDAALRQLQEGVVLKDGIAVALLAKRIPEPEIWPRQPPIRQRQNIPTSWIELCIDEGRNRQVRRMSAAAGFPTLRLVRWQIGEWTVEGIEPGTFRQLNVHVPATTANGKPQKKPRRRHR
jgi:23S rRNA pseudouridine2457 synthase